MMYNYVCTEHGPHSEFECSQCATELQPSGHICGDFCGYKDCKVAIQNNFPFKIGPFTLKKEFGRVMLYLGNDSVAEMYSTEFQSQMSRVFHEVYERNQGERRKK